MSEAAPLITRTALFAQPALSLPQLSPDGSHLSVVSRFQGGPCILVGDADVMPGAIPGGVGGMRPVVVPANGLVPAYNWAYTNRHILHMEDQGQETAAVFSTDIRTGETRCLTGDRRGILMAVSPDHPDRVVIGIHTRSPAIPDLYLADIVTGELELLLENPGFPGLIIDSALRPRLGLVLRPDGSSAWLRLDLPGGPQPFLEIGFEDTGLTAPLGFDRSGRLLHLFESRGRDTTALAVIDMESGAETVLAERADTDIRSFMSHPATMIAQAAAFQPFERDWQILDPAIRPDLERLAEATGGGAPVVTHRTLDDRIWIVLDAPAHRPPRYLLYRREQGEIATLFDARPELAGHRLAPMTGETVTARDGLRLSCLLSLPPQATAGAAAGARPRHPLPMVLIVHGGPWAHVTGGYDASTQLLANRGYAVLSVNFRGSTGQGKAFLNAGNREWGGRMVDDLADAAQWAVAEGIADPARIGILGGSYGGYAVLMALARYPALFACGIDLDGPTDLAAFVTDLPGPSQVLRDLFARRIGDPGTPDGLALLERQSPIGHAAEIARPLLMVQCVEDIRVPKSKADAMVEALLGHGAPVAYLTYSREGHVMQRPENGISFMAVIELFLARWLGGRCEDPAGAFAGSTVTIEVDSDVVPGLAGILGGAATA